MLRLAIALLALCGSAFGSGTYTKRAKLARTPFNQQEFSLLDAPDEVIVARIAGIAVYARYLPASDSHAVFTLRRGQAVLYTFELSNLYNPNGWFTTAPGSGAFAITWSDGGAIGGFHTRVFRISATGVTEDTTALRKTIQRFEALHYCKARGNNYLAVRWVSAHALLLEASVYPTSDCGPDLGYTERFVVDVPSGRILQVAKLPR